MVNLRPCYTRMHTRITFVQRIGLKACIKLNKLKLCWVSRSVRTVLEPRRRRCFQCKDIWRVLATKSDEDYAVVSLIDFAKSRKYHGKKCHLTCFWHVLTFLLHEDAANHFCKELPSISHTNRMCTSLLATSCNRGAGWTKQQFELKCTGHTHHFPCKEHIDGTQHTNQYPGYATRLN